MLQYFTILMAPPPGGESGPWWSTPVLFGSIILIFYFMIIRPQRNRAKEREKMIAGMKKGDDVVTSGGMYGQIVGMDEKYVLVEIAPNVKVKVDKGSVTVIPGKIEQEKK